MQEKKETKDNKRENKEINGKSRHKYYYGKFKFKHTNNYIKYRKKVIWLKNIDFQGG